MAMTWNPDRIKLFHAVYERAAQLSKYAADDSIGSGLYLKRGLDAKYLSITKRGTQRTIDVPSIQGTITVRDATRDSNRFTGIAPFLPGLPAVPVTRGGLYTSEENTALLAELFHYADPALPRDVYGKPPVHDVVAPKCLVTMKTVRELIIADLDTSSQKTLQFLREIQSDKKVDAALKALGYPNLLVAVHHPDDYSAGRALGLALASNSEIDGMRITSARGFTTSDIVGETGNNVVLFGENLKPASGLVQVTALHLVELNAVTGMAEAVNFTPGAGGELVESSTTALP